MDLCVRKIPWSRKWELTSVFLPRKAQRQRNLAAAVHAWGHKKTDTTELLNNNNNNRRTGWEPRDVTSTSAIYLPWGLRDGPDL